MKKTLAGIIIASLLTIPVVFIIQKSQAQNTSPKSTDNSGDATGKLALAKTEATPKDAVFVTEIPTGYRDWKVVSVAHEAGDLNDIRAILGNDIAIKAYRENKLTFPEGAIVGRIAWSYIPSEENNKTLAKSNLSWPAHPRLSTCSLWKRTQRSTQRQAAGDIRPSIITANLPARRLCKAVTLATNSSNLATLFSPVTHLKPGTEIES